MSKHKPVYIYILCTLVFFVGCQHYKKMVVSFRTITFVYEHMSDVVTQYIPNICLTIHMIIRLRFCSHNIMLLIHYQLVACSVILFWYLGKSFTLILPPLFSSLLFISLFFIPALPHATYLDKYYSLR